MSIPFHRPFLSGNEHSYLGKTLLETKKFSGDGPFTKKVSELLERKLNCKKVLLTTSCTHAMEMAAILFDIEEGDEVIMPSYTFVSTANAFVLRGAKIVWIDVDPETMNVNLEAIKSAISPKTKVIVPVQYAGLSCDMDPLLELAKKHNLFVMEDAAQSIGATYKGKPLGTLGDLGAFSFHETKNVHCGEGGVLAINNPKLAERAEIIREKGTNRSRFFRGEVDKYTWVDLGSSYLPSELNAAFLLAQLESEESVTSHRKALWERYSKNLNSVPGLRCIQKTAWNELNGHIFYVLTKDENQTAKLITYLKSNGIQSVFHYVPLHSSPYGMNVGRVSGSIKNTENYASRLVRLPLYYDLTLEEVDQISMIVRNFFNAS